MILPVFDYGDLFYTYASKTLLSKLQVLQNKAIRNILRLKARTNVSEHEKALGLLPLQNRRKLHTLQFAYTLSFNEHLLDMNRSTQRTRSQNLNRRQYRIFRPNKSKVVISPSYQIRYLWNSLPTHLHMMPDRHQLKNALLSDDSRFLIPEELYSSN